jgi:hypothetical protein
MNKILSIHQPELLPWYGYIHKLYSSDIFVLLDDVQFKKNNFQNRNKILTKNGEVWLSIPVESKNRLGNTIRTTQIVWAKDWRKKFISSIKQNYSKHPYFFQLDNFFLIFEEKYETLFEFSYGILNYLVEILNIKTRIILQSDLQPSGQKTELLLDICKKLNSDNYLMGGGGSDYFDYQLFKDNNINVLEHKVTHPEYLQMNSKNEFVPYMCFIDIIANVGIDEFKKLLENDIQ